MIYRFEAVGTDEPCNDVDHSMSVKNLSYNSNNLEDFEILVDVGFINELNDSLPLTASTENEF
jgi:hypothetical protein